MSGSVSTRPPVFLLVGVGLGFVVNTLMFGLPVAAVGAVIAGGTCWVAGGIFSWLQEEWRKRKSP